MIVDRRPQDKVSPEPKTSNVVSLLAQLVCNRILYVIKVVFHKSLTYSFPDEVANITYLATRMFRLILGHHRR